MPAAFTKAPNVSTTISCCKIRAVAESSNPGSQAIVPERFSGHRGKDADVVLGASVNAIEAKRAVHVARLPGLKKQKLAAGNVITTTYAVLGLARVACAGVAYADMHGAHQRLHEIELADRADILAERRTSKKAINHEGRRKVSQDNPGGPPRTIPESKGLVGPQEDHEQTDSQPFVPKPGGPVAALRQPAPGDASAAA